MTSKSETTFKDIDFNAEFSKAIGLLENTRCNVFISGKAGTGKSTLLNYFQKTTEKDVVVLAPTGVAAVNIKGQTIHSFCHFRPNITLDKVRRLPKYKDTDIYQEIDMIIIDEISMVRADLIDCVDKFLRIHGRYRSKPFGGLQMIFIGDLYQLPPVVSSSERMVFKELYSTPYFFSGKYFDNFKMEFIELEQVYRQKDREFVSVLNSIRNNTVIDNDLKLLNSRVDQSFIPSDDDLYIYLVTTNKRAEAINSERLNKLFSDIYTFTGMIKGDFDKGSLPALIDLELKVGSQIMMLNNDVANRWINGTIGQVIAIKGRGDNSGNTTFTITEERDDNVEVIVKLETGLEVKVNPFTWELYKYDLVDGVLQTDIIGTFKQYPMKLAWAITIHKSQGKTFNNVIIDIGSRVFASGQTYVALSRCTSLEGIVLKAPIVKKHIWSDINIVQFVTNYQYEQSEKNCSLENKVKILTNAADAEKTVAITYLKVNDVKSKRSIVPLKVERMTFKGSEFMGVVAHCVDHGDRRVFRVDRILEIA